MKSCCTSRGFMSSHSGVPDGMCERRPDTEHESVLRDVFERPQPCTGFIPNPLANTLAPEEPPATATEALTPTPSLTISMTKPSPAWSTGTGAKRSPHRATTRASQTGLDVQHDVPPRSRRGCRGAAGSDRICTTFPPPATLPVVETNGSYEPARSSPSSRLWTSTARYRNVSVSSTPRPVS